MKKRSFGKLQLNRETLRNLSTGDLERVVGGAPCTHADTGCGDSINYSDCAQCLETATCLDCSGAPGICSVGWCSGQPGCVSGGPGESVCEPGC